MKCLIVVDVQNDFIPGGALAVPEGDQVVPVINRLMTGFDFIIGTQDWHPATHGSFADNHPGRTPGEVILLNGIKQILWPRHCVQDTPGAAFVAGLEVERISHVIHKGTDPEIDSYSTFFDNAHQRDTGLSAILKARGVTEIHLAGLATDYCVKYSALDALKLGFLTHVHLDGCRGVNLSPDDTTRAIDAMRQAGVVIESLQGISIARQDKV